MRGNGRSQFRESELRISRALRSFLLRAFREKGIVKGRQECLPHLRTHFDTGSTSHCTRVRIIDS